MNQSTIFTKFQALATKLAFIMFFVPAMLFSQNNAVYLDGNSSYIDFGNDTLFNLVDDFTIELWVQSDNPGGNCYLLSKGDIHYIHYDHNTEREPGPGYQENIAGLSPVWWEFDQQVSHGQWYHVCYTYDGATKEIKSYVNGQLTRTGTKSGSRTFNSSSLRIALPENGRYFKGYVDELRLWTHVRTEEDINSTMGNELTGNETGLLAYYDFNESSGITTADQTSRGNDGGLFGNATFVSSTAPVSTAAPSSPPFAPVDPTGLAYNIVISDVAIDGVALPVNSQIGVFDGSLCVGSAIYDGNPNLQIITWEEDAGNGFPGFTPGNPITIKARSPWYNQMEILDANLAFTQGNGTFKSGAFSVVSLDINSGLAPDILLTGNLINLNSVTLGNSDTKPLIIQNTGNAILKISNLAVGSASYSLSKTSTFIDPGQQDTIHITFSPAAVSDYEVELTITSNDPDENISIVNLNGTGLPSPDPVASISPATLFFDGVGIDSTKTRSFSILNKGNGALTVTNITSSNSDFSILGSTSFSLSQFENRDISVSFSPTTAGYQSAVITISDNDGDHAVVVSGFASEQHFNAVEQTGKPYNLIIEQVKIDDKKLKVGDEIAVFDNLTCVGSALVSGGKSIQLANSGDMLSIPSISIPSSHTLEAWVMFPLPSTGGGYRTLFNTGGNRHHILVDASGQLGVYNYGFYGSNYVVDNLNPGWHHVASVSEGSSTDFYIDGNFVGTSGTNLTTNVDYLGNYSGGGQNIGFADEFRVWNYARTAEDIKNNLYELLDGSEPGLIGYWGFNNNSLEDLSTYNRDASYVAGATIAHFGAIPSIINLVAWEADGALGKPGFSTGNPMSFKVWANVYSQNYEFNATPTYTEGNGTFADGLYSVLDLKVSTNFEPDIHFSKEKLFVGQVEVNKTVVDSLTIYNSGNAELQLEIIENTNAFTVDITNVDLPQDDSVIVRVTFSPLSAGNHGEFLTINSNDPDSSSISYKLEGFAIPPGIPDIGVSVDKLEMGGVITGKSKLKVINIINTGTAPLDVTSISSDNPNFSVTPTNFNLANTNDNQEIYVLFSPDQRGLYTGSVSITSNGGNETISLRGVGYDGHFASVEATGLPYSVVVEKADLFNHLEIGDEIGIYDGALCVGSTPVLQDTGNIQVIAWKADPETGNPGFTEGNPITFKVWSKINGFDSEFSASADFILGDGNFGYGQFTVANLLFSAPVIELNPESFLVALREPDSTNRTLEIINNGDENLYLNLFPKFLPSNNNNGKSFTFDGNNDHVNTGNMPISNTWTVEAWVRPSAILSGRRTIAGGVGGGMDWGITMHDGYLTMLSRPPGGVWQTLKTPANLAEQDEWYHLAATNDGDSARLYLNGKFIGSQKVETDYNGYDPTRIGGEACCAGNNFPGTIDEVRVWNYPRPGQEIFTNMFKSFTGTEPGLEAYYTFDDGTATDLTGKHNGTIQEAVVNSFNAPMFDWLTVNPLYDTIAPLQTASFDLKFNSKGLLDGLYEADLYIFNNTLDPEPEIIPVSLNVSGNPQITSDVDSVNYGQLIVGEQDTSVITLTNIGSKDLTISDISMKGGLGSDFTIQENYSFPLVLAPVEERILTVIFAPTTGGDQTDSIQVATNDSVNLNYYIPLFGSGQTPPDIELSFTNWSGSLNSGDFTDDTLVVYNRGQAVLGFTIDESVPWLAINPESDSIGVNDSVEIALSISALGVYAGQYQGVISVNSNDYDEPRLDVVFDLTVIGFPAIHTKPTFNIGDVFIDTERIYPLEIENKGTDTLFIDSIAITDAIFVQDNHVNLILPGQKDTLFVSFTPTLDQLYTASVSIYSNDPANATWIANISGRGVKPQDISVSPVSFNKSLQSGESQSYVMTIFNSGGLELDFEIETLNPSGNALSLDGNGDYINTVHTPKLNPGTAITIEAWVYLQSNSNNFILAKEMIGIGSYRFFINSSGRLQFTLNGNKNVTSASTVPTGTWTHVAASFDGTTMQVFMNGALENSQDFAPFTINPNNDNLRVGRSFSGNYFNGLIDELKIWNEYKNASEIATYMDETLDGTEEGLVLYYKFDEPTGNISTDETANNQAGTLFGDATRELSAAPVDDILSISSASGTVVPGGSKNVILTLRAFGLTADIFNQEITINSNDVDEPQLIIPVNLAVTGWPEYTAMSDSLMFDDTFFGFTDTLELVLKNTGAEPLTLDNWLNNNSAFFFKPVSDTVLPFAHKKLKAYFSPVSGGIIRDTLTILTNDPVTPEIIIPLKGLAVEPPVMEISDTLIDFGPVIVGESFDTIIVIKNTGASPLEISSIASSAPVEMHLPVAGQATINAGDSLELQIKFMPTAYVDYTESITINTNIGTSTIDLEGAGIKPGDDVGIVSLISPTDDCAMGDSNIVEVLIRNFGSSDQTGFDVGYMVNGQPAVIENVGTLLLPAGTSRKYTFTTPVDMEVQQSYQFELFTNLGPDVDQFNDTLETMVTNYPELEMTISGNQDICAGNSVTLIAGAPESSFLWSTGSTHANITVSPSDTTIYQVTATSIHGCTDHDSVRVNVRPLPPAPVISASGNTNICVYDSVLLSADIPGIVWNTPNQDTSQAIHVKNQGSYFAANIDTTGCQSVSNTLQVTIETVPELVVNGATTICLGDFAQLTVSNAVDYSWSTGETLKTINVAPLADQTYSVTMTTNLGCEFSDSVDITVINPTAPDPVGTMLPPDQSLDVFKPIDFSWVPGQNSSNYDIYVWNVNDPQSTTPIASDLNKISYRYNAAPLQYGQTYEWMVVSKNSCFSTEGPHQTFSLRYLPDLEIDEIQTPPVIFAGQPLTISWECKNSGIGSTNSEQWKDGVYLSLDTIFSNDDEFIGAANNLSYLVPNQSYSQTATFDLPSELLGNYYVLVVSDYQKRVAESNEGNNSNFDAEAAQLTISVNPKANLIVNSIGIPSSVFSGNTISVNYTGKNISKANAVGKRVKSFWIDGAWYEEHYWYDAIYLSKSETFSLNNSIKLKDVYVGLRSSQNPGASEWYNVPDYLREDSTYQRIEEVSIPWDVFGEYHVYMFTDRAEDVPEDAENNNVFRSNPINIILSPPANLAVDTVIAPASAKSSEIINIQYRAVNAGGNPPRTNNWVDKVYISELAAFDISQSELLATEYITDGTLIDPDEEYTRNLSVQLPDGISGQYYIHVHLDADSAVFEHTFDNNNFGRIVLPVNISLAPYPDFTVSNVQAPDTSYLPGIIISWQVLNEGQGIALPDWSDRVFIQADSVYDPAKAVKVATSDRASNLVTGAYYTSTKNINLPPVANGNYYLIVFADINNDVYEHAGEGNNYDFVPIFYADTTSSGGNEGGGGGSLPQDTTFVDLRLDSLVTPANTSSGQQVNIKWSVKNHGTRSTKSYWYDEVYLSSDTNLDSQDELLNYFTRNGALLPGEYYSSTREISIPNGLNGQYYLIMLADSRNNNGTDTARHNNLRWSPINITLTPPPDLQVNAFTVTPADSLIAGQQIKIVYTVQNKGTGSTVEGSWQDNVYLSATPDLAPYTYNTIGTNKRMGDLGVNQSYTDTIIATVPGYLAGFYYLVVSTDGRYQPGSHNKVYEHLKENNNSKNKVVQVVIPDPSDLVVSSISIPPLVNLGEDVSVTYSVKNIGSNKAIGNLSNAVYFSEDTIFSSFADFLLQAQQEYVNLQPGDSIVKTITSTMPGVVPGGYYGIGRTNLLNSIVETNLDNNTKVSADTMEVSVNELFLDVPDTFNLDQGDLHYYKVVVGADLDLVISLNSNQANGSNEVYVAYDRVPTLNDFDHLFDSPNQPDQQVLVPSTQAGTYYILVRTPTKFHGLQNVVLLARALPFSIISIEPDTVGNGVVTTRINGAGFREFTKLYLLEQDSTVIDSAKIKFIHSMQLDATWDLSEIDLGTYHVKAVNNDTASFILANGLTVEESTGFLVDYNYISPSLIRLSGKANYVFYYENIGNVDIPFVKGDYTVPTYTSLVNMSTVGDVYKRSELTPGTTGPVSDWVDYSGFKHIPFVAKDVAPGEVITVSLLFRDFGNSAIFPMRVRAYGYSKEGYLKNQLNMAEGTRLLMETNPGEFGINQNPSTMALVTNPQGWRDSVLNLHFSMGLLEPSDTVGYDLECQTCVAGFEDSGVEKNFTYDPGLSPGTEKYIKTSFDAGEDYLWEINQYNGNAGIDPGWDLVRVNGRLDITATAQNPFVIRVASLDYDNEPDYLAGWDPTLDKCWPIAIADGGISGFDTSSFVLDLSRFTTYNEIYNGTFHLGLQGTDSLMLCFKGDGSLTGIDPLPDHEESGLPDEGVPCGRADNLGQTACDHFFSTISCPGAVSGSFASFIIESGKPLGSQDGLSVALHGSWLGGLNIAQCNNAIVEDDLDFNSPNGVGGQDLLGCSSSQTLGSSTLINCVGQFICNQVVRSCDPNDIIGPRGYGEGRYVSVFKTLPYTIRFENDPEFATTAAQRVTISQQLDDNLDPLSFRVKDFGYADFYFTVDYNTASYFNTLDLPDSLGYDLEVTAGIDINTNQAFWVFQTIDPRTGLAPTDPLLGFLDINDSTGVGEGFVNYTINSALSSSSGDTIDALAEIVFDINEPIITPEIFNTIDAQRPVSEVQPLPSTNDSLTIPVDIVAFDEDKGSGLSHFMLYVSENDRRFRHVGNYLPGDIIPFEGQADDNYKFVSIAVDNVGHNEAKTPDFAEAETVVKLGSLNVNSTVNHVSCFGKVDGSIFLDVTGGEKPYAYEWSNGDTASNLLDIGAGTYMVTITDTRDSTAMDTFEIVEPPQLQLNLGNDTLVFDGETVIINATPIYDSYLWSDNSINSTLIVDDAGTYWVEVQFNTCIATDTITVGLLEPVALPDTSRLCPGETITLDAGAGYDTYSWSNGSSARTITVGNEGAYSVTVTLSGNTNADTSVVVYKENISFDLGANRTITDAESVTLSAPAGYDFYDWNGVSGSNTYTFDGATLGTGVHQVELVVTQGSCSLSDMVQITVVPDNGNFIVQSDEMSIMMFPNPASDHVYLVFEGSGEIINIQLQTLTGEVLLVDEMAVSRSATWNKDISGIVPGAYLIRIVSNEKEWIEKLIIY